MQAQPTCSSVQFSTIIGTYQVQAVCRCRGSEQNRREPGRDGKIPSDHRQDGNDEVHSASGSVIKYVEQKRRTIATGPMIGRTIGRKIAERTEGTQHVFEYFIVKIETDGLLNFSLSLGIFYPYYLSIRLY